MGAKKKKPQAVFITRCFNMMKNKLQETRKKNIMDKVEWCKERMEDYLPRWRHIALECLGIFFLFFYIFVGYYILLASINILDWTWTNAIGIWQFVLTLLRNWVCKC